MPARVNALAAASGWRHMLPRLVSGYPAAAVVLAAHFLIAAASVREKWNTYDELAHIVGGYSYWTRNDYRLQPDNGILPQRWLALPLLTLHVKFPEDQTSWAASDVWTIGDRFVDSGNDLEEVLWRARCMNVFLSAGLGLFVYAWSRKLFGSGGGMISLLNLRHEPDNLGEREFGNLRLGVGSVLCGFGRLPVEDVR